MKPFRLTILLLFPSFVALRAQMVQDSMVKTRGQYPFQAGILLLAPIDKLASSHRAGAGLDFSWCPQGFDADTITYKKSGFIMNGGVRYLPGKSITVAGHGFRYGNLLSIYAMPGYYFRPVQKGYLALFAGPELNGYRKNFNLGLGAQVQANYCLSSRVAMGPGIVYKKRNGTPAMWMASIRAGYRF